MKKVINKLLSGVLSISLAFTSLGVPTYASEKLVAFPGAEGGGMYTQGARASDNIEVFHVTNLNNDGRGSFRDAVSKNNRIIVFDVAGNIVLTSKLYITATNLTILGQTAPGEGVCIAGESIRFGKCDNIILRYLRFRMGDKAVEQEDGLGVRKSTNFIIDHCSIEWSVDECLSAYENKNFTAQYCIISESLNNSVHDKGQHGYGGIWGGVNASFHHNLLSSHKARIPRIGSSATVKSFEGGADTDSLIDVRNNVVYNYRSTIGYGGENGTRVNFVNNYYKPSEYSSADFRFYDAYQGENGGTTLFIDGNYVEGNDEFNNDNWTRANTDEDRKLSSISDGIMVDGVLKSNDEYIYDYPVTTVDAKQAYADVIANAGASKMRDYTDTRIVNDVINGTCPTGSNGSVGLIDSQNDVGGWNNLYGYKINDSDNDGISDEWELANGLDPNNKLDSVEIAANGYTNIENYANDILKDNDNSDDKSRLWIIMDKVDKLNGKDYFAQLWNDVETAYNQAMTVRLNNNSKKSEIDTVADRLENAVSNLAEDLRSPLIDSINNAQDIVANKMNYTKETYLVFESELANAKNVLTQTYNEKNIISATEKFNTAVSNLKTSNRIKLLEAIDKYSYDNDDYTKSSYLNLKNELANANNIYNAFDYDEQGYIDEIDKIIQAVNNLEPLYSESGDNIDFKNMEVGTSKDNIVIGNATINKPTIKEIDGNKVLSSASPIKLNYDSPISGKWCISYDFYMSRLNYDSSDLIKFAYSSNISITRTGELYLYTNRSSYFADINIKSNKWYNIKAVIDKDNGVISVYIDNKVVLSDIPFNEDAKNIVLFYVYDIDHYCNNIKAVKRIDKKVMFGDADNDNQLTANDVALVVQKALDDDYYIPIEDISDDYIDYIDVDRDGKITSVDAAYILQKVLDSEFMMPADKETETTTNTTEYTTTTETTTTTTTETTTETTTVFTPIDRELNFDSLSVGSYNSPYNLSKFEISRVDGNNIDVVEKTVNYGKYIYNNAINGNDYTIKFMIESPCKLQVIGSTYYSYPKVSIDGILSNGDNYSNDRYLDGGFGEEFGYMPTGTLLNLESGTYTLKCSDIMLNYIRLYNTIDMNLDLDSLNVGQYSSPYSLNGFIINGNNNNVNIVESSINYDNHSYNNAIDGNNHTIQFTIDTPCNVRFVGTTASNMPVISINGTLTNGEEYSGFSYVEPIFGDSERYLAETVCQLQSGTYTINCNDIMLNNIHITNK